MIDDKSPTEPDDAEILQKFRNLLGKYHNHGKIKSTTATPVDSPSEMDSPVEGELLQEKTAENIPMLTEVVVLNPSVIQPQPKRSTPIQQILDAALQDAHIDMNSSDRKALADALEAHMSDSIK